MGGRERRAADRSFPFGYPEDAYASSDLAAAERFWADRGVRRSAGVFHACFIGSFTKAFDFSTVLRAMRRLPSSTFRLILCGDGEMLSAVKAEAADLPNVVFPGWVNGAQIRTLMELADAGLAPYQRTANFQKNIPNKAIEYLAGGLPIVTSLSGELGALLTEIRCGVSYAEGDERTLADALLSLHQDAKTRAQMRLVARRAFEDRFMASTVYEGFARFLESLVSTKQGGHP
jgi:glycosyltransferase involved in cell wall biosynthesis